MQVEIENLSPLEKKISVKISADVVTREIEATYRALNQKIKLKGFRPGKIPQSILARLYKNQVEEEVATKLINDSLAEAVKEHNLAPVSEPNVLNHAFTTENDFTYAVSFEVKPELTVQDYLGVEIEVPEVVVTEEELNTELEKLQENHAQLKPLEDLRPVRAKDMVLVDFEGTLAGQPIEGWKVVNHLVEAGSGTLIGDLDKSLIGMQIGEEKDINLTLPVDYLKKELAGKEITVHLKVKEIKEKILPPVDDEFAKDLGEYQTVKDLKEHLHRLIEERKKEETRRITKEKILEKLVANYSFSVPKTMIERQVQSFLARAELQLAKEGRRIESATPEGEKLREAFLPLAEKEVRGSLILEKIAEIEKISVSEAELDAYLEKLAKRLNRRVEAVKSLYQQRNLMDELRQQVLEEKTLDFLIEKAKIKINPHKKSESAEQLDKGDT
ncbi:MAG: trigger factor [Thermodesulfobacteriota bacterium]